ncbi:structure-specific endonuclease subunit SLX1 [Prunus yedoensis var. nudiflora]|uniref:Structure-specific endonuclease subunit SLX1 n=1 Tax=Prunus yedoensis var. nudiflora TaxID=2094558 RepID=A0A314Y106_PRUYE|nr:structure-specific endonuclease subunit SLX1 [Prunus yedoensis var. nudiflora]
MFLCIYGFPTNVSALQFGRAWQHPTVSKGVRQADASFKSLGGLVSKIKLAYTMLTLPPWQRYHLIIFLYTKHSAGCPRLPEQMKVKVFSMDELPSCTKLSDDLLENEDEWCHESECDEDMNSSTLAEETLLDFRTHNSADDQQSDSGNRMKYMDEVGEDEWYNGKECDEAMNDGTLQEETLSDLIVQCSADDQQDDTGKIINEAYGCSQVVGEDCTEQFGFMASPVRTPTSNVTTLFDTEVTKDAGLCGSSDDMNVDLGRPAREQLTVKVADDDQSPSRSYLRSCGADQHHNRLHLKITWAPSFTK